MALSSDAPQTTLVADVAVLEPHTTLKALVNGLFQGIELPHTTDVPVTFEPHTTELPQTTEEPQTTEDGASEELPYASVIVPVLLL